MAILNDRGLYRHGEGHISFLLEAGEKLMLPITGRAVRGYSPIAYMCTKGNVKLSFTIESPEMVKQQLVGRIFNSTKDSTLYVSRGPKATPLALKDGDAGRWVHDELKYAGIADVSSFTLWQEVAKDGNITTFVHPCTALLLEADSDSRIVIYGDF